MEEQCPHVTLLTNDLRSRHQISQLVRAACSRGGSFNALYNTVMRGGKLKENKGYASGSVVLERGKPPVTVHFIALAEAIKFQGLTGTVY